MKIKLESKGKAGYSFIVEYTERKDPPWSDAVVIPADEISPEYARSLFYLMLCIQKDSPADRDYKKLIEGKMISHSSYFLLVIHKVFNSLSLLYQDTFPSSFKEII